MKTNEFLEKKAWSAPWLSSVKGQYFKDYNEFYGHVKNTTPQEVIDFIKKRDPDYFKKMYTLGTTKKKASVDIPFHRNIHTSLDPKKNPKQIKTSDIEHYYQGTLPGDPKAGKYVNHYTSSYIDNNFYLAKSKEEAKKRSLLNYIKKMFFGKGPGSKLEEVKEKFKDFTNAPIEKLKDLYVNPDGTIKKGNVAATAVGAGGVGAATYFGLKTNKKEKDQK